MLKVSSVKNEVMKYFFITFYYIGQLKEASKTLIGHFKEASTSLTLQLKEASKTHIGQSNVTKSNKKGFHYLIFDNRNH